jgi:transcriptional regulator GlxA family with amidase domain
MRSLIVTVATALLLTAAVPSGPTAAAPAVSAEASSPDRLRLPPPKAGRARPLVAVVAGNDGAETTDFTIPYGVLKDSGVADVLSLSTRPGPVQLVMSLRIQADATLAQFDAREPAGADVVIVPAMMSPKDPVLAAWLRRQAAQGATIVSVCEGARVLAHAGLLDGRRATTHWHAQPGLEKAYPATTWVRDRRYVQDGAIISTTGVTASIPMSLALVEAIGGRDAARATAARLGVNRWSAAHRTADYRISGGDYVRAIGAIAAVWSHETVEAPVADGVDEIALALRADVWARSFRSKVVTTSASRAPVRSRHGLVILPDQVPKPGRTVIPVYAGPPARQLDAALADMGRRYGPARARLARLGLEYDTQP